MKFIKKFTESDSWAGSLLAYDRHLLPVENRVLPQKTTISYLCNNCGFNFLVYNNSVENCLICDSSDIKLDTKGED